MIADRPCTEGVTTGVIGATGGLTAVVVGGVTMLLTGSLGSLSRTVGNGCSRLSPFNLLRPKRFNSDLNLFKSRAGI